MSHRRLPNARGTVIRCDGYGCGVESHTGQVVFANHRAWLRSQGWSRGQLRPTGRVENRSPGTFRHDLCPTCSERDQASGERRRRPTHAAIRRQRARIGASP